MIQVSHDKTKKKQLLPGKKNKTSEDSTQQVEMVLIITTRARCGHSSPLITNTE